MNYISGGFFVQWSFVRILLALRCRSTQVLILNGDSIHYNVSWMTGQLCDGQCMDFHALAANREVQLLDATCCLLHELAANISRSWPAAAAAAAASKFISLQTTGAPKINCTLATSYPRRRLRSPVLRHLPYCSCHCYYNIVLFHCWCFFLCSM